ncbi:MAG: hypothetical protein WC820_07260, partial [Spirochaetales bacterium]
MSQIWKEGRLTPAQKRALIWAIAALAACLGMNAYHYSLEGAKGLYVWNRTGMFRMLILMGFIPASIALLSFPLEKLKGKSAARIFRGLAISLSFIVILASVGIFGLLVAGPRLGTLEPARLELISPADGITPHRAPEAAFQSGEPSLAQAAVAAAAAPTSPELPLLRFSFSSDPHWGVETADESARTNILAGIAERKPDAFFMLGDTVETGSSATQWNFALSDLEAI